MSEVEEGFEATDPNFGADASQEKEVEQPVEVEAETGEESKEAESEAESPPADEENVDKKTNSFEERIKKLNTRWRETERALTALEQENQELRQKVTEVPTQVEEVKTLADFDYDDKQYQTYLFTEAKKQAASEVESLLSKRDAEAKAEIALERFSESERTFAAEHDDYFELTQSKGLIVTNPMADVIRGSDVGPELAYHLGKNPDVARKISKLSDAAVGRELTLIETQLKAEKAKPAKEVSKAPPPPPAKIGGDEPGKRISTTEAASDKMSDKEWFAAEEKRKAKLRG